MESKSTEQDPAPVEKVEAAPEASAPEPAKEEPVTEAPAEVASEEPPAPTEEPAKPEEAVPSSPLEPVQDSAAAEEETSVQTEESPANGDAPAADEAGAPAEEEPTKEVESFPTPPAEEPAPPHENGINGDANEEGENEAEVPVTNGETPVSQQICVYEVAAKAS